MFHLERRIMYDLTDALNKDLSNAREMVRNLIKQTKNQTKRLNVLLEKLDWVFMPDPEEESKS